FAQMDEGRIGDLVALNLIAPIELTRGVLPGMLDRGRGRIVNVASVAAHVGVDDEAVYAATKWGLAGFTESLRAEMAGTGVGVSLVSPGVVRTAFFERRGAPYARTFPAPIPPGRVARAIIRVVERDEDDAFEPRWMALPARLRGAWPRLYRTLAARFG
ncbi:MAG TPA: SDR family NAD(P)-dependent oxidoreductase, partial [Actinomycetota bacterium]|nr:SDR family NAD(P)-dependent oxidoreductase [Actinomycetota bacterium]